MIVFKSFFKVLLRYKWIIFLYSGICIGVSILNSNFTSSPVSEFVAATPDVAIINNDEQTEFVQGLNDYISQNADIKQIENKEEKIQDALFYRDVNYVIIIPENYTEDFLEGKNPEIEIMKTKDSYATYMEMLINRYLKMADIYSKAGMNQTQIIEAIKEDIKNESKIIIDSPEVTSSMEIPLIYYTFANYSFLAISIFLISTVMAVFNNDLIKKKNSICKKPYKKIANQLLLGNIIFVLFLWIAYVTVSFIMFGKVMLSEPGLLFVLNSLIFVLTSAAIGFLISTLIKNKNAISGVVNVVALGLSFISGCFVPQQWLNETVLTISKFFPCYWYINTNNKIMELTNYTFEGLKPIYQNMLITLGFGVVYVIAVLVINKVKISSMNKK